MVLKSKTEPKWGLPRETSSEELHAFFAQFGEILEAVMITDRLTGRSKGYGFVTFRDPEAARRAVADPNPIIGGRRSNCNIASLNRNPSLLEVWTLVRRFDEPQKYKPFVRQCVVWGGLKIGSVREISLKSGSPTTEVLEHLNGIKRVLGARTIDGDHILKNYSSIIIVHPSRLDGEARTTVIESYVVDVPEDRTEEDMCYFLEVVIQANLKSLADVSERLVRQQQPSS